MGLMFIHRHHELKASNSGWQLFLRDGVLSIMCSGWTAVLSKYPYVAGSPGPERIA